MGRVLLDCCMWGRARCAVAHRLTRHCTRLALFSALTATHVALSRGFAIVTASASRPPLDASNMDPHAYTALPIAAARALSSERSAGVQDPLARKLVAGEDQLLRAGANVEYMTKRALIGDELVLGQHGKGVRQVVSLGAGMDSRAFRLGLNDTVFYEVDKSGLFDVKEPLVASDPCMGSCAAYVRAHANLPACLGTAHANTYEIPREKSASAITCILHSLHAPYTCTFRP